MVLSGCKMFRSHLTVHLVVCEAFLCLKSSKYPQDAPTPVIPVKYPTVCVMRLCCFPLAGLILCGRWSPLPSHCRMTAACLSSWAGEAAEGTALCTIHNSGRDLDRYKSVARSLLNKHVEEQQQTSQLNLLYAKLPVFHTVQGSRQLMQMMHRSSHLICYRQLWGRAERHHIRFTVPGLQTSSSFLEFLDLWWGACLCQVKCVWAESTGGIPHRKALISSCSTAFL